MRVSTGRHYWLAVALLAATPATAQFNQRQGVAPARGPDAPKAGDAAKGQAIPATADDPAVDTGPIISDSAFDAALPTLSGDINAPLEPMPKGVGTPPSKQAVTPRQVQALGADDTALPPAVTENPELARPLIPLTQFDTTPLQTVADIKGANAPEIRYDTVLTGLQKLGLEDEFKSLSALEEGKGRAANATQVAERAREDAGLAVRLMKSLGYYDGTAISLVEAEPGADGKPSGRLRAMVTATPGRLYRLSSIKVDAQPVVPPDLITHNLPLKVGDPIEAARIQAAEANVSLVLPQQGYPFVKVGDRDILLDDQSGKATGAYTLPVDTGPRSRFGKLVTAGDPVFGLDHLNVFPRFKSGDLYDSRKTDDLRDALVATGLFSSLSVQPEKTGRFNDDGTEAVDLLVRQTEGPTRSLAGSAGYSTGQGFKAEGSWTSRNLFPPEGAVIGTAVAGTQEQGLSATFRRSNAGKRDKTFLATASAAHNNYDAFEAYSATISGRWSYVSTPIWQKRFTYYYGGELVATNESVFDFASGDRVRRNYGIVALPAQVEWDTSNSLLNPTKGYRLRLNLSPEGSVSDGVRPYVRTMIEGTFYYPVSNSLVIAGRAKAGSIQGIERDDLAPSRRYYGGGGGSVRGYGYQRLGPLDPQGNPVGGLSLNEFSIEARYRFGDFGIVPFLDAGNSYASSLPKGNDLKFGAGLGGRFYTNFGPIRIDVATPLDPRPGDSRIALYISIGQAY